MSCTLLDTSFSFFCFSARAGCRLLSKSHRNIYIYIYFFFFIRRNIMTLIFACYWSMLRENFFQESSRDETIFISLYTDFTIVGLFYRCFFFTRLVLANFTANLKYFISRRNASVVFLLNTIDLIDRLYIVSERQSAVRLSISQM